MKLVIYPHVEPERLARIIAAAGEMQVVNAASEDDALAEMPEATAFFGKITPPLLAAAGRLSWVQSATASLEHYMFPALVEHPCALTNMRGIFGDVIAEHVLGFLLCFARNLHVYVRRQVAGRWDPIGGEAARSTFTAGPGTTSAMDLGHHRLAGATLGIVGLGQIGGEVARLASAFGMRVIAVDPRRTDAPAEVHSLRSSAELPSLLAESDYVVIAAPHTPQTVKLFRRPQFAAMKRTAYLVNIGRGAIVDLADLTAALEAGEIAGAALDVFEVEPLPAGHPLWRMENVIITPHVAGTASVVAERHLQVLLDNIDRFRRGAPLLNPVDKRQWF